MMDAINDGGPAFPQISELGDIAATSSGMSLRAYISAQTLVAIGMWCPHNDDGRPPNWSDLSEVARLRAEFATMQADALIAELAKGGAK